MTVPLMSLTDKLEQQSNVQLPMDIRQLFDALEPSLRNNTLTQTEQDFLSTLQINPDTLKKMLDPLPKIPEKVHLYHCDHLGTPQALINNESQIDWQIKLDPFGQRLQEHNPQMLDQSIRMQGQHFDEESGLHYNRHRYYDPESGRYISQDPIG